jgi:two-component system, NarL family, response regulator DesR
LIRILLAEDMRVLRETLAALLGLEADFEVVVETADGREIVSLVSGKQPDVAVIDIDLPGLDGLTAAAQLRAQCPQCRVLILTVLGRPGNVRRALAAGVAGFLPKDIPAADLVAAVRKVAAGERVIDQRLMLKALEVPDSPLSPREAEVLRLYAAGAGRPRSPPRAGTVPDRCRALVLAGEGNWHVMDTELGISLPRAGRPVPGNARIA